MIWIIIEIFVFISGSILALAVYLQDPNDIKALGAFGSVILLGVGIARRARERYIENRKSEFANDLAVFIEKGNVLKSQITKENMPIKEHNEWVDEIQKCLSENGKRHWITKLNDFTGYKFYSNVYAPEVSKLNNNFEGRIRRLHEFISEIVA